MFIINQHKVIFKKKIDILGEIIDLIVDFLYNN